VHMAPSLSVKKRRRDRCSPSTQFTFPPRVKKKRGVSRKGSTPWEVEMAEEGRVELNDIFRGEKGGRVFGLLAKKKKRRITCYKSLKKKGIAVEAGGKGDSRMKSPREKKEGNPPISGRGPERRKTNYSPPCFFHTKKKQKKTKKKKEE